MVSEHISGSLWKSEVRQRSSKKIHLDATKHDNLCRWNLSTCLNCFFFNSLQRTSVHVLPGPSWTKSVFNQQWWNLFCLSLFLLVQYGHMCKEVWWKCQKKLIELCFIALQSASANDNNRLMNIITLKQSLRCNLEDCSGRPFNTRDDATLPVASQRGQSMGLSWYKKELWFVRPLVCIKADYFIKTVSILLLCSSSPFIWYSFCVGAVLLCKAARLLLASPSGAANKSSLSWEAHFPLFAQQVAVRTAL